MEKAGRVIGRTLELKIKRQKTVARQKRIIVVFSVFILSLIIIFGSAIMTFAQNNADSDPVKEYESIQVQNGDTLWTIAKDNAESYNIDTNDYIDEVKSLNGLTSDNISCGSYIVVPTYHYDN